MHEVGAARGGVTVNRKTRRIIVGIAAFALAFATLSAFSGGASAGEGAHAVLHNQAGAEVGHVKFSQEEGYVLVKVEASFPGALTPGFKGFHVHAGSGCTGDFVASAGAHLGHDTASPPSTPHGTHEGDMPVLLVNSDGGAWARFQTDRVAVADLIGHTVIVHAGVDNYANIPARYLQAPEVIDNATYGTGDAGSRYACGEIG